MSKSSVVVVGPHPDDQELGMGGTIARLARQGHRVHLIDMTNGEPTPNGSVEARARESAAAAAVLGVGRTLLGLKNREVVHDIPSRHALAALYRVHRPNVIFVPYPVDAHPDHVAVTRIAEDARFDAKLTKSAIPGEPWYPKRIIYYYCTHLRMNFVPTFCIDVSQLEQAITPRTKALVPVHLTGDVAEMPRIMDIAKRHKLPIIEDGCQSLLGEYQGRRVGTWGNATAFSMHPLKIINVWGDAGIVVTNDDEMNRRVRLLRNHGLRNRDEMEILGYNSRLDSTQAVVGKWIVRQLPDIVAKRIENAAYFDAGFRTIPQIRVPARRAETKNVYLLYVLFARERDALLKHCIDRGIEAKVHYPIPLHLQDALKYLGYKVGDFPIAERHCREVISFPVDQHLSREEQDYVIETVREFYAGKRQ